MSPIDATGPTRFEDLNDVLRELATRAAGALDDNFVGAYLVGSFALGDGDEHSDVDFIVVTDGTIDPKQEADLRAMHAGFPDRPVVWAQHLEGSYPPRGELRTMGAVGRRWLYVDNGSKTMERSTHCNTAFVRWTLREHGITLAGLPPWTLVDAVTSDDLRQDGLRALAEYATWVEEDASVLDDAWTQPYVVTTFSRIMHTVVTGRVATKRDALTWARDNVEREWTPLIDAAIADRPDPWNRVGKPARAGTITPTHAFAKYVVTACESLTR